MKRIIVLSLVALFLLIPSVAIGFDLRSRSTRGPMTARERYLYSAGYWEGIAIGQKRGAKWARHYAGAPLPETLEASCTAIFRYYDCAECHPQTPEPKL